MKNVILTEEGITEAEKLLNIDDLFDINSQYAHHLLQALKAKELFVKDTDYVVKNGEILIVDGGPYVMEVFETIDYGYPLAIVITESTTVTVTMDFRNEKSGTIYVFGTLNVKESDSQLNEGNIYVMEGGSLNGEITYNSGNIKYECSMSGILTSHEIKGKAPAKNEDGWKDFYVKDAIFCENDYYPIPNTTTYYTDATMETSIPDLEYWKQHDGKLEYSLDYLKTEAINAINEARKGLLYVESYYKQVEKCIDLIKRFYLDPEQGIEYAITEIDRIKSMAFVYIKDAYDYDLVGEYTE